MADKPNLTLFKTEPVDKLPSESLTDFKQWVLNDGLRPSEALRKLMDIYNCPNIHDTTVIQILKLTYPDIDLGNGGFRTRIIDSAYPNSDPTQFSDEDFDKGIEEILSLPNGGW